MPSADDHNEKYLHNKRLLGSESFGVDTAFSDWYVTIMFYSAVHMVERELANQPHGPFHSRDHAVRLGWVTKTESLRGISKAYLSLYVQSRRARYDCVRFTKCDIVTLEKSFSEIESHLDKTRS